MKRWRVPLVLLVGLGFGGVVAIVLRTALQSERQFHPRRSRPQAPVDLPVKEVRLAAADGVALAGWYLPSRSGSAVVFAHGLGQDRTALLPEARVLSEAGHGVLLLDFRGHGESEGQPTYGVKEQLDLEAALRWVRAQPDVDPKRVGALGFSIGSDALAEVAARDPALAAVSLHSPFTRALENVELEYSRWGRLSVLGARIPFWMRGIDLDAVRPVDVVSRIAVPVLMVVGAEEPGQWMTEALEVALPPHSSSWVMEGAGHGGFIEVEPVAYPARLREYFGERLGVPASHHPHRKPLRTRR